MGVKLHCDRCGRFVRTVNMKSLKELDQNEVVCAICERTERVIQANIEGIKKRAQTDFQKMADNYKELVTEIVRQKVAEEENGNPG